MSRKAKQNNNINKNTKLELVFLTRAVFATFEVYIME